MSGCWSLVFWEPWEPEIKRVEIIHVLIHKAYGARYYGMRTDFGFIIMWGCVLKICTQSTKKKRESKSKIYSLTNEIFTAASWYCHQEQHILWRLYRDVRFKVLTAANMKIGFWDITSCSVVKVVYFAICYVGRYLYAAKLERLFRKYCSYLRHQTHLT
jgi:hypothetical protein